MAFWPAGSAATHGSLLLCPYLPCPWTGDGGCACTGYAKLTELTGRRYSILQLGLIHGFVSHWFWSQTALKQTVYTLGAQGNLIYRLLLVLLLAYGSDGLALCNSCAAPQTMACKVSTEASLRSDCCCEAAACGNIEQQPPSHPAIENSSKLLSTPSAIQHATVVSVSALLPLVAPSVDSVPPPLFQLYCSFLI